LPSAGEGRQERQELRSAHRFAMMNRVVAADDVEDVTGLLAVVVPIVPRGPVGRRVQLQGFQLVSRHAPQSLLPSPKIEEQT
jgi:hypothetical protein